MDIKRSLTRKLGPLPAWAWLLLFGVGVWYYRRKMSPAASAYSGTGTGSVAPASGPPQAQVPLEPGQSVYDPNTGALLTAPGGGAAGGGTDPSSAIDNLANSIADAIAAATAGGQVSPGGTTPGSPTGGGGAGGGGHHGSGNRGHGGKGHRRKGKPKPGHGNHPGKNTLKAGKSKSLARRSAERARSATNILGTGSRKRGKPTGDHHGVTHTRGRRTMKNEGAKIDRNVTSLGRNRLHSRPRTPATTTVQRQRPVAATRPAHRQAPAAQHRPSAPPKRTMRRVKKR